MPSVMVYGVPEIADEGTLLILRLNLINVIEKEMGIKEGMTRVFFPQDKLGDPRGNQDNLIWGFLYTGMFNGAGPFGFIKKWKTKGVAKRTTKAIADTIKKAFDSKIGVEVFVRDCNPETKTLLYPD